MKNYKPIIEVIEEEYEIPHLKATRKISALLPYDYHESDLQYPVLYLQDGQNLFNPNAPFGDWAIDQSMAQMASEGFKDIIIIAIDHGEHERIMEYLPYMHPKFGRGKGRFYIQFMKEKLIPYVNKHYRTLTDYENTGIGGSSMGGLISLFAGLKENKVFGKLMVFSPSLWISEKIYTHASKFKPLAKTKIYLYAGAKESLEHLPNVRNLETILQEKLDSASFYDVKFSVNEHGQHKELYWRDEFPKAIKWLFFKKETMKFQQRKILNPKLDIILPFHKGKVDLKRIKDLTKVTRPDFDGEFAQFQILYGKDGRRINLIGLGEEKDAPRVSEAFRKFSSQTSKYMTGSVQVDCRHLSDYEVSQAVLGFQMSTYRIGAFKSDEGEAHRTLEQFTIFMVSEQDRSRIITESQATGESINSIKALVDAPANHKTPQYLSEWAQDSATRYGYDCKVLKLSELKDQGFGAVIAVGQGSVHEPHVIINSYLPKKNGTVDLGLVGKGITFDSGGLSIKGSQNMHYMKSDMGGAAAVFGAIELAAKLKLNVNIVGVIAAAENAVDANSIRPGDVITGYSGKTIEIIDTDAEGRLVMSDALSYIIKMHQPKRLLDVATLTGSVVRTLGYSAGGIFTKNKELANTLSVIGESIHERVWPLPMYDDFEADIHSDIADIRNFSGKPIAGGIAAAKFLEAFTKSHPNWAHLDIAGVAFGSSDYAKMKSATGFGVRLLVNYMKQLQ